MSYCPKCGAKVSDEMAFCPRCGAPLKAEEATVKPAPTPAPQRVEKAEKREKREKEEPEKGEKHEKREFGFIGWLIGGLVLIFIGVISYINWTGMVSPQVSSAVLLVIIGVVIIIVGLYITMIARRRHPAT